MRIDRILLTVLIVAIEAANARMQAPTGAARAADVIGQAERRIAVSPEQWTALKTGDSVTVASAVRTRADSAVLLSLPDQHVVRIGENTTLELRQLGDNHAFSFALLKGRIWSFVDKMMKPAKYEVETGSVILGVSGTVFSVSRDDLNDESDASVSDGQILMRKGRLTKSVQKGLQIRVLKGRLAFAQPRQQTRATLAMWKSVGSAESWAHHGGALHLSRDVEKRTREVQAERQHERALAGGAARRRRG